MQKVAGCGLYPRAPIQKFSLPDVQSQKAVKFRLGLKVIPEHTSTPTSILTTFPAPILGGENTVFSMINAEIWITKNFLTQMAKILLVDSWASFEFEASQGGGDEPHSQDKIPVEDTQENAGAIPNLGHVPVGRQTHSQDSVPLELEKNSENGSTAQEAGFNPFVTSLYQNITQRSQQNLRLFRFFEANEKAEKVPLILLFFVTSVQSVRRPLCSHILLQSPHFCLIFTLCVSYALRCVVLR